MALAIFSVESRAQQYRDHLLPHRTPYFRRAGTPGCLVPTWQV